MKLLRAFAVLGVGLSACASQGVPDWAMHVRPDSVDLDAQTPAVAGRLLEEMALDRPPAGHLPPEQLAAVAIRELEQNHQVDAALWLSMASYRYHQEALIAINDGVAGARLLPVNANPKAYGELVTAEIERFVGLEFHREMQVLDGRAYGRSETEAALQEQLTSLGKTSELERESLRDTLWQLQPAPAVTSASSRYPELVEAFRRRLVADFGHRVAGTTHQDRNPAVYLAQTPIPALQAQAVDVAVGFSPQVCRALTGAFPTLRPTLVARLSAARPDTRINAAVTLGLAPSAETRPVLEARLAVETDERVKLALAHALVHHGVAEQAVPITSALRSCQGQGCTLAVMLAQWLPSESKLEIDQAAVARIARGADLEPRAHLFAAALLRDIGLVKPLDAETVEALIIAARRRVEFEDKEVAVFAYQAIAQSAVLSREAILARLATHPGAYTGQDYAAPGPLLARLAKVAEAEDLPLLTRMMVRFGRKEGPEPFVIVEAAFHIPGDAARARLLKWLDDVPSVRSQIVIGLLDPALKTNLAPELLERTVAHTDAHTSLLYLALRHSPQLTPTLVKYLQSGAIQDRWAAAELAGVFSQEETQPQLRALLQFHDGRYYPNDALIRHAAMKSLLQMALRRTAAAAESGGH